MKNNVFKKIAAIIVGVLWIAGVWTGYQHLYGTDNDSNNSSGSAGTITIGYQRGDIFNLAQIEGGLKERLNEAGYKVKWKQFTDGSALMEALVAGSIDYGRTGNTPPVVSQSTGSDVVYVTASSSKYEGSAILTPEGSTIAALTDLAGKKVAVSKGSSAHYFLIKALESVDLAPEDVDIQYLDPSEGRIALENNQVDAWVVWDPYTAAAQEEMNAQILTTAEGFSTDRDFILSSKQFASENTDINQIVVEEMANSLDWVNNHKTEIAEQLAETLKLDASVAELMVNRRTYGMDEISDEIMSEQQDIADTFYQYGFIDNQITVTDAWLKTSD
ncbi:aliphatic sulfonate ABC transporter substrate-binding protein [Enterococcus alishanensis]|uniref:Aliphatic sulfonate ABC transporter substrate-binding protein n=1 Tax=Enterococcus alishanensis TaxID=1303817 RepID=A0ABS6TDL8_9ENTE|nr:aliphatic sulfonate ABC transporter substrate-binding protein [Enterococcus alishanensis]MBV7391010.1 aliphatic sulfonate ABC transporter substrate-binding protein [Enterococcus alishanensis]